MCGGKSIPHSKQCHRHILMFIFFPNFVKQCELHIQTYIYIFRHLFSSLTNSTVWTDNIHLEAIIMSSLLTVSITVFIIAALVTQMFPADSSSTRKISYNSLCHQTDLYLSCTHFSYLKKGNCHIILRNE